MFFGWFERPNPTIAAPPEVRGLSPFGRPSPNRIKHGPNAATGLGRPNSRSDQHGDRERFRVRASPISPISVEGCKLIDIHSGHHGTGEWRVSAWLVAFDPRLTPSTRPPKFPTATGLPAPTSPSSSRSSLIQGMSRIRAMV